MANVTNKAIDKTYLSVDQAERRGFLHRDYIAHCFRWSHVIKWMSQRRRYEDLLMLDIGCGKEAPMLKMIYSSKMRVRSYVGVDAGPIQVNLNTMPSFPYVLMDNLEFDKAGKDVMPPWEDDELFDVAVCFEVLEHMEPLQMIAVLQKIKSLVKPKADIFISTPNWDRTHCAGNHVNEIRYEALGAVLEREGFTVHESFGTFASLKDYEHLIPEPWKKLQEKLREYFDTNVLACIFAPMFPAESRNCLWHLKNMNPTNKVFKDLAEVEAPWGSSSKWKELSGEANADA